MSEPSTTPDPDVVQSPYEYIPPAAPPSVPVSESMRRLAVLLSAGKLSTADPLTFSYNGSSFVATLTPTGALSSPAPRPSAAHPTRLSHNVRKLYESPKDFASEMALLAVNADPKKSKPRGRLSINGWEQCMLGPRSLESLRLEMLREKKPSAAPLPNAQPPRASAENNDKSPHHPHDGKPPDPDEWDRGEAHDVKDPNENHTDSKPAQPDSQRNTAKSKVDKKPSLSDGHSDEDDAAPLRPQSPPTKAAAEVKPASVTDKDLDNAVPMKPDDIENAGLETTPTKPEKATRPKRSSPDRVPGDKEEKGPPLDTVVDEEMPDAERSAQPQHSKAKDCTVPLVDDEKNKGKSGDDDEIAVERKTADEERIGAKIEKKSKDETGEDSDAREYEARAVEPDVAEEKDSEQKIADEGSADEAKSGKEKAKSRKSREQSEKPSSPPVKQESKKRKRGESNESSPSEENAASRRSQERGAAYRIEWGRKGRKLDIPSASEMTTEGLDPEAIEAAAIAAQAEKEEANSRARRTTRLASGKIKQVDYKASANAQGSRSLSPGREFDDVDNSHSNDSGPEPVRTNRRRAAQNLATAPQRISRRVARKRSSQERDQSSNDDLDHSSPGNGSDGFGDGDSAAHDGMEIDTGAGSRLNGSRTEGRERKRARSDAGTRRTRQNHAEMADFDADDRAPHGTRSSTRENSVADGGEVMDGDPTENDNVNEDMEEEEDPEKRTDRYGWTIQDLTRIGDAVDMSDSTEQQNINVELYQAGNWTTDEATNKNVARYVQDAISCIAALKKEVLGEDAADRVSVSELRAFIASDIWRLKTGGIETEFFRKPAKVVGLADVEEQMKTVSERSRRKLLREVEELRRDLDAEMDNRRKADLDAAYVEIQLSAITRNLPREEARRLRLEREIERYQEMEMRTRNELDRTKILVSQLRGETDSPDDVASVAKNTPPSPPQVKQEECENEEMEKGARVVGESVTSEDDVGMKPKEEASASERQLEMERLRVLIAAREAEAEANQRGCEVESMKFVSMLEGKNRLETELYSHRMSGSFGAGGGVSGSPGLGSSRSGKDGTRKAEGRNGGSGGQRGQAGSRGRNTKPSTGTTGGGSQKGSGASKPKNGSGRTTEASKSVKKKTATRVQNSPSVEKP